MGVPKFSMTGFLLRGDQDTDTHTEGGLCENTAFYMARTVASEETKPSDTFIFIPASGFVRK